MYSGSNSYMGGNSLRPGPQQYGSSFGPGAGQQQPQQQQQQQQPSPFAPQPTGFGQAPLQQQFTGYPGMQQPQPTGMQPPQNQGQLQPQYTGFPGQAPQQQSFQTGAPPMPPIPQQFQSQFQQQAQKSPSPFASASGPSQAPSAAPMKPQPTGFTEMAASFHTGAAPKSQEPAARKSTNKIPNIRLSFINAADQSKFESLFKSAVGDGQTTMSGEKARDLLLTSRLDGEALSHIWCVSVAYSLFWYS